MALAMRAASLVGTEVSFPTLPPVGSVILCTAEAAASALPPGVPQSNDPRGGHMNGGNWVT
jgi:hypothetical protein